jgi:hypothetical protein
MPTNPQELISQAAALLEQARQLQVQLTRADLADMNADQINTARKNGQLHNLLNNKKEN